MQWVRSSGQRNRKVESSSAIIIKSLVVKEVSWGLLLCIWCSTPTLTPVSCRQWQQSSGDPSQLEMSWSVYSVSLLLPPSYTGQEDDGIMPLTVDCNSRENAEKKCACSNAPQQRPSRRWGRKVLHRHAKVRPRYKAISRLAASWPTNSSANKNFMWWPSTRIICGECCDDRTKYCMAPV